MFIRSVFILALFMSFVAYAENNSPQITVEKLEDDFYLLHGGRGLGANVGVHIGESGLTLIDTMVNKNNEKLHKVIKSISPLPIIRVINTHADFDHTGGNRYFAELGATIISQDNIRYTRTYFHQTFHQQHSVTEGLKANLYHFPAHAHSDILVHLVDHNIIFMGDILTNVSHATFYSGGFDGFKKAINQALKLGDQQTKFIGGHGHMLNAHQLENYLAVTQSWISQVNNLYKQGHTVDLVMKDPLLNRIIHQFNDNKTNIDISSARFKRFIERTISTELIPVNKLVNLATYTGTYQWDDNSQFEITHQDNKLFYKEVGRSLFELIPLTQTEFHGRAKLNKQYLFSFNDQNKVAELTYVSGGKQYQAKKVMN